MDAAVDVGASEDASDALKAVASGPVDSDRAASSSEHARILVAMARLVGAGFCAYLLTSIPLFGQPPGLVADWFTPVGAVVAFGPGVALLVIAFIPACHHLIPVAAIACSGGYLLACGLWFVAWNGWEADAEQVTWLMSFSGLPSLAWVLVRPGREAVAVLIVCASVAALITDTGRADVIETNVVIEATWTIVFTLCFLLAAGRVVRTGRLLDHTRDGAMRAAGRAAAVAARNTERARFDALIHDHVTATLIAAYSDPDEPRLPHQAARALAQLQEVATGSVDHGDLTAAETLGRLRAAVTSIDPEISVVIRRDGVDPQDARYPSPVVRALGEAVGEAVRNSVGHAGPDAECAVLIETGPDTLRVTVVDDGDGFDPSAVPPERLGVEVSIRQRLREVTGAQARLSSAPGEGTAVQLGWERR
ncbi:sensor histidine kinase [Gordonia hydrophobica]|uniref:ATP-binding protein n=1 Tax=Gordonia hydrophobica TaxID=40516 RepID=A0ABZ2TYW5_9ACTN|nr:ATP-binding protein [Gordonia hydrophobica]MBM7369286.1 signal transduction histidine kinase [Gordonia hydrophobica]